MKKILASDTALKIISVITAIIIWAYISIVMNPSIEVAVRDLPIQFVGAEVLESKGLAVVSESESAISVKIKGNRKKMGSYDMKTIIVKADESIISNEGTYSVPVEVIVPFENQGISSQSAYTVDVKVEKIATKSIDIDIETKGKLKEDYASGEISVNPKQVTISGPESLVGKIDKAFAELSFSGEEVDIDKKLQVKYKGEDGKEILSNEAILERVKASVSEVDIHCPVLKIRRVKIKANFGFEKLPDDLKYEIEPNELYLYGDNSFETMINEISTEVIPLNKLIDNEKIKVKLSIPSGVKVIDNVTEAEISIEKK